MALVRVQDVIIGRFIGTAAVGQYRTAWRTVELISQGVIMPFTQVALPTLGRLQDDLPAFRKAYLRIMAVCSAVAVPAIVGFAVLAPDAIPLVFGDEWAPAAPVAQVLGLMAVPFTHNRFAAPALATLGRYGILARLSTLQLVLTIVMSIAAAPYGLVAVAGAYVARAYLMLPFQMWVSSVTAGWATARSCGRSRRPSGPRSDGSGVVGLDAAAGDASGPAPVPRHRDPIGALPTGAAVAAGPSFVREQLCDLRGLSAVRRRAE